MKPSNTEEYRECLLQTIKDVFGITNSSFDEKWNTLESHNAGQEELNTGYYHYFIYDYDNKANSIQMIKTDKSLANRREVARYDVNGIKLTSPQKGVNIILYSDGTSNKVIEK